jgi:peptide/nickel transport system substrate-binding protein
MAPDFGTWYKTGGESGEEPTEEFKAVMDLYDQYRSSVDAEEQLALAKEIVRIATEHLYTIGTVGMSPGLVVVSNNFHNVMSEHTSDWLIFTPGTQDPPQFWIEQ